MKKWAIAVMLAIFGLAGNSTQPEAAGCRNGESVTVTGRMGDSPYTTRSEEWRWGFQPDMKSVTPCTVSVVFARGQIPPGCGSGRSFGASGRIVNVQDDKAAAFGVAATSIQLFADEVRCQ